MGCGRPLVTGFIKNPVIIGQFCLEQAYNSSCSNIYNNNNIIPYLPVYNARLCIIHTLIFDLFFPKKKIS